MAKNPKWQADVVGDPQGGGPLMVRSTNAGAVGRATAQMGRDLFQAGYMITREAREAEEKTRSLQRATEVSRFALEANKGFNQLKGDLSKEPDPDKHLPAFNEFASGQIERLSTIGDEETRNRAEIWLNDELGFWDKDISTNVPALRIKQTSQHIEAVTQNAIEDRNIELLETVGQDLVTEGFWSLQQYSDYHGQVDERISKELDKDVIAGEVLSMEPDAAVRHLKDRARPLHMTVQEWADYRDQLHARLDVNRAAAAQEQRAQTQLVHANDDQLITDALQGKLDLPAGIGLVQKQLASVEALDQARRIAIAGPATTNQPAAYDAMVETRDRLQRGTITKDQARDQLNAAADQLTPQTRESFSTSFAAGFSAQEKTLQDAGQYARSQLVTVTDTALTMMDFMAAPDEQKKIATERRARQYQLLEFHDQALRDYLQANPNATQDDLYIQSRKILFRLRQQGEGETQTMLQDWESRQVLGPIEDYDAKTRRKIVNGQPSGAPVGLETMWEQMSAEEKASALRMLGRGVPPEMILEALGGNP